MYRVFGILLYTLVSVVGWKHLSLRSMSRLRPIKTLPFPLSEHGGGIIDDLQQNQRYKLALDLLDCLTSPKDENDPQYSFEKDTRRDALLLTNDYSALKSSLRRKGLRTSGDKLEMITRLLLHEIDPLIRYDELAGPGPRLAYIDEDDIRSEKVRVRTDEERAGDSEINVDPDADDMRMLKHRPDRAPASRLVMDGLDRREILIEPVRVRRTEEQSRREDLVAEPPGSAAVKRRMNGAYFVKPQQNLPSTLGCPAAVVLLPGGKWDWRSKGLRVLADELCFASGAIVVVPDIARQGRSGGEDGNRGLNNNTRFDDIIAAVTWMRTEYGARAVTLAGVSDGAGLAMEVACDLQDIGRLAQYTELEAEYYRTVADTKGSSGHPMGLEDIINELLLESGEQMGDQADCGHLLTALERICEADKEVFLRVGAAEEPAALQASEDGDAEGNDLEDFQQVFEEMEIETEGGRIGAGAAAGESAEGEEEGAPEGDSASAQSIGDLLQQHNRVRAEEARQRKMQRLREEWAAIARSAARARERRLVLPYPSIAVKELKHCVPRAVLALEPQRFDPHRVGQELQCALFVAGSGQDAGDQHLLRTLHDHLDARKDQVVDYCLRVYDEANSGFVVDPANDHDKRCAQQAVGMGSLWLEAFSGRVEDGLLSGIGTNKYGENAFSLVRSAEMVEPIRPSATATHFHDQ